MIYECPEHGRFERNGSEDDVLCEEFLEPDAAARKRWGSYSLCHAPCSRVGEPDWRPYEPERRDLLGEMLESLAETPDAVEAAELSQAVADALCESEGDERFMDEPAAAGVPLADIVRDAARRFDERPLYRASIEARRELAARSTCDCWEVPDRHLDPDGHVPTCPESDAARYRCEPDDAPPVIKVVPEQFDEIERDYLLLCYEERLDTIQYDLKHAIEGDPSADYDRAFREEFPNNDSVVRIRGLFQGTHFHVTPREARVLAARLLRAATEAELGPVGWRFKSLEGIKRVDLNIDMKGREVKP